MRLRTSAKREDQTVIWLLEAEEIEFTWEEYDELVRALRLERLFAYLKQIRPALESQILAIFRDSIKKGEFEISELEHALENALLNFHSGLAYVPKGQD